MRTLELIFKSSDDKTKTLSINYASGDLTAEEVQSKMEAIAGMKMFAKDGANPYEKPLAARYKTTQVEPVFDSRK